MARRVCLVFWSVVVFSVGVVLVVLAVQTLPEDHSGTECSAFKTFEACTVLPECASNCTAENQVFCSCTPLPAESRVAGIVLMTFGVTSVFFSCVAFAAAFSDGELGEGRTEGVDDDFITAYHTIL